MLNPSEEDTYDLPALDIALAGTPFAGNIRHFPTIHSTNVLAMREADEGAPEGMVYLADEQTAGRGRGAHSWHSARGAGLYVSILLRPTVAPADILWLSLAAGLAVREAVRQVTSLEADIRWPNDLLFGKKKFCGILTELNAEVTRVRHAVVGIGINVHQESFPAELGLIASSLRSETGRSWARQDLLIALLQSLYREAQALSADTTGAASNILKPPGRRFLPGFVAGRCMWTKAEATPASPQAWTRAAFFGCAHRRACAPYSPAASGMND